jgi:hypothetical protein
MLPSGTYCACYWCSKKKDEEDLPYMPLDNAISISFLTLSGQCLSLTSLFNISCTNVKMSLLATSSWIETWTGCNSSKVSVPSKCCRLTTSNRKSAVSQDLISPINCTSCSDSGHSSRASTTTITLALFINIARRTPFKLSVVINSRLLAHFPKISGNAGNLANNM